MENINLDLLPKEGARMLEEIAKGNMVVARSASDFLYIIEFDNMIHMFSHRIGAPGGGQKQFQKDEKSTTMVRKIADLADAAYIVDFDKNMNLYSVMFTAEQAILDMFPGEDRDNDGVVDFMAAAQEE